MIRIAAGLIGLLPFLIQAQTAYIDSIQMARSAKEVEFKTEVLTPEEAVAFQGICYFPVNSNYRITAAFERKKGKKFPMPMTKERLVYYRQYGVLTFVVNDTMCSLAVYENLSLKHIPEYENYLFLPFRDGTTAITTYGGGRYLDVTKTNSEKWIIDFNNAYHPYCVYSDRYSCPIPPKENTLIPAIPAGECYVPHD